MECKCDCLLNIDGECTRQSKENITALEKWKNDFRGYVNSLSMPKDDYNGIMEYVDELPVNPQEPKTGHWKRVIDKTGRGVWECSKCHWEQRFHTNFCPDCGIRMVEPQESEDGNGRIE